MFCKGGAFAGAGVAITVNDLIGPTSASRRSLTIGSKVGRRGIHPFPSAGSPGLHMGGIGIGLLNAGLDIAPASSLIKSAHTIAITAAPINPGIVHCLIVSPHTLNAARVAS